MSFGSCTGASLAMSIDYVNILVVKQAPFGIFSSMVVHKCLLT